MSINITPIPRLIDLAAPAFTLGTANAAGEAETAVASNSTLLAFDGSNPAAVAASPAVGSATVAARRDHVHAGTTASGTVVDEAITRFDGTSGASLQGYSSLSPTISDAGIISLTSGALAFPATAIASGNANTLDDYEEGTWSPALQFGGSAPGIETTLTRATYAKIGRVVYFECLFRMTSKGAQTGGATIAGLPFTLASGGCDAAVTLGWLKNITFDGFPSGQIGLNTTYVVLYESTDSGTLTQLTNAEFADNSQFNITGHYEV